MDNPIPQEWVKNHSEYLLTYALEHLSDRTQAEILVHNTFLLAINSQATFSSDSALRKWLTAILKNKITDLDSQSSATP